MVPCKSPYPVWRCESKLATTRNENQPGTPIDPGGEAELGSPCPTEPRETTTGKGNLEPLAMELQAEEIRWHSNHCDHV